MKAIVLKEPGQFEVISKASPGPPGSGEVLLKIKSVSICGTDLHAFNGKQPFFTYRTGLSWWIFVAAGSGAIVISLVTVSFQAIKAAIANPLKSLRTE